MIDKNGEVYDHIVRIDFVIKEGKLDKRMTDEIKQYYIEHCAVALLFCFGYVNIRGIEIRKIES